MRKAALAMTLFVLAACSGGGPEAGRTPSPTAEGRPSSTARLVAIDQPANNDTIKGPSVKVVIRIEGAALVPESKTGPVSAGEGHLRVTLDNGAPQPGQLEMTLTDVSPGEHVIRVELVALDNKPFEPRVQSAVLFNVT